MQNMYNTLCKMSSEDLKKIISVAELIVKFKEEVNDDSLLLKFSQKTNGNVLANTPEGNIVIEGTPQQQDGEGLEQGRAKPIFMYDAGGILIRKFDTFSQTSKWLRENGVKNSSNKLRRALAEGIEVRGYYFRLEPMKNKNNR